MKELFLFNTSYEPDCASTNRVLSFARGFGECGVKTTVFFWKPSARFAKVQDRYENVCFVYLWEKCPFKGKKINQLLALFKFYSLLEPSIPLLCYDFQWLNLFSKKRGLKIFHERTENPEVIGKSDSLLGKLFWKAYKRSFSVIDGLFVITPSLKKYFIRNFGIDESKVEIVNMTVDATRFDNLSEDTPQKAIGYCGTISEYKDGIDDLIKAFALFHRTHSDYKLLIAGKWENEGVKERTMALIDELALESSIIFKGLIPFDSMPSFLKSCQVLALSRPVQPLGAAGFATKIGEYLMTGRPVVMTDIQDVDYFLEGNKDVLLARPSDPADFAEKLSLAVDDARLALQIGSRGQSTAKLKFNYKIEARKIIDFIDR